MKTYRVLMACFVIASFAVLPCNADEGVKEPALTLESDTFDFGEKPEGIVISHDYAFTNTGNALLKIEEVRPTCGCTIADDYSREVAPGSKGKISISFKTQGYDGPVTKSIFVRTNVAKKPELYLTLQVNVKPLLSVNPKNLFLGNIDDLKTESLHGTYTITNITADPVAITEIVPPSSSVKTEITEITKGFVFRLDVTVAPPFKEHQNTESIMIKTDNKALPELRVMYSYTATTAAKVNPIAIMLSNAELAKGTEKDITIGCREGYFLSIAEIKSSDPLKGRSFTLTVRIPAGYALNDKQFPAISFRLIGVPNGQVYSVPIYKM
jgi:hypothetical protein